MGELAVSRALGDAEYKGELAREVWGDDIEGDLIVSTPEVTHTTLTASDDFVILACDGLWDVMSNQDAVDLVSGEYLRASSAEKIARVLVKEALRLGSQDNVSVIVVFLKL